MCHHHHHHHHHRISRSNGWQDEISQGVGEKREGNKLFLHPRHLVGNTHVVLSAHRWRAAPIQVAAAAWIHLQCKKSVDKVLTDCTLYFLWEVWNKVSLMFKKSIIPLMRSLPGMSRSLSLWSYCISLDSGQSLASLEAGSLHASVFSPMFKRIKRIGIGIGVIWSWHSWYWIKMFWSKISTPVTDVTDVTERYDS